MISDKDLRNVAVKLFEIDAVKFGDFLTKSGVKTPVYFDLRVIVSYPDVMKLVTDLLYEVNVKHSKCDHLCGVPYTALPVASLLSVRASKPMLMRRKEAKGYGTKKMIEGHFKSGDTCLIIEDVVTSGSSVLETANDLRKEGLKVAEALVILDRQQGGAQNLAKSGVSMQALFSLTGLVELLVEEGKLNKEVLQNIKAYLSETQITDKVPTPQVDRLTMSYEERAQLATNPVTKRLLNIMATKKTNLCLAADLTRSADILKLVEEVGDLVCMVKTHADIIEDWSWEFVRRLRQLAEQHAFLLMEDRKFADIGNTVAMQYSGGVHRIAEWADVVTAHALPGPGVLQGLAPPQDAPLQADPLQRPAHTAVFLLAEMSSEGNLCSAQYCSAALQLAAQQPALVAGVVGQAGAGAALRELPAPAGAGLLLLTPGVRLDEPGDKLGQTYRGPAEVCSGGADIAVVGRGVAGAAQPRARAHQYRDALWQAYTARLRH